ncbi:MAG: hypothetical protein ACO4CG_06075 [Prochlorothrix sp.]
MNLPPLHPPITTECQIQGDVVVANDVVMAPGVMLLADPGSRIVISAGVSLGMGVLLHARGGTIAVEAGTTLGAGVLMVGQGTIGAQACVGASTTVFEQSVPAGAIIAPGSVVSQHPRALVPEMPPTGHIATPSRVPMPATPAAASSPSVATFAPQPSVSPFHSTPSPSFNQGFEAWDDPVPPAQTAPTAGEHTEPTPPSVESVESVESIDPLPSQRPFGEPSPPPGETTPPTGTHLHSEANPVWGTAASTAGPEARVQDRSAQPSPSAPGQAEARPPGSPSSEPPRLSMPHGFQFYSPQQTRSPAETGSASGPSGSGLPQDPAQTSPMAPATSPSPTIDRSPSPPAQPRRVYGRDYFLQMRWSMFPDRPPSA